MSRIGGPIYDPTSVAAGVGGDMHDFSSRYRGAGGSVLHPLQRAGVVSSSSHSMIAAQGARSQPGLGGSFYPAGVMNMTLPPIVPIGPGSSRDPAFMV